MTALPRVLLTAGVAALVAWAATTADCRSREAGRVEIRPAGETATTNFYQMTVTTGDIGLHVEFADFRLAEDQDQALDGLSGRLETDKRAADERAGTVRVVLHDLGKEAICSGTGPLYGRAAPTQVLVLWIVVAEAVTCRGSWI